MYTIVLALHIFVCILLIVVVLLQSSKGSDLGSALGGGGSNMDMFGPSAPASIMNKVTTAIAACFLILSLVLALLSTQKLDSVFKYHEANTPVQTVPVDNQPQ